MPEGIQVRGPHQFRVQVRRNGVYQTKTFEKLSEAQEWQRVMEGKVTGEEPVDLKRARSTPLARACDWMLDGKRVGTNPDAKNVSAKLRSWQTSKFADWSLASIHDWDLIEWRREGLDEDGADDGEACGPAAEAAAEPPLHRLKPLPKPIQTQPRPPQHPLHNP